MFYCQICDYPFQGMAQVLAKGVGGAGSFDGKVELVFTNPPYSVR